MKLSTAFLAMLFAAAGAYAQSSQQPPSASATAASATSPAEAQPMQPAQPQGPQLQIIDNVVGTGATAVAGTTVRVHYTGWLFKPLALAQHGKKFDSSVDRGEPLDFKLGAGMVIKGWDQGVAGMKVGGKRTLIIPSELAYGHRSVGPIPPDSDLIFDVELLGVK
ncbi:MAG: FKBP-type peptidyl-prolyl cis-trans isomerase [Telluria sp.]